MTTKTQKTSPRANWLWRFVGLVRILHSAPLAHREAERLARVMWRRTYIRTSPDWQPLPDTVGVISQIDNMHAGVLAENERMHMALINMANMPEYDQDDAHRLRHQAKLALPNAVVSQPGQNLPPAPTPRETP
jgi:hypothetical protein